MQTEKEIATEVKRYKARRHRGREGQEK